MRRAAAAWAILLLLAVPAAGAQDAGPLLVETLDGESYEKTIGPGGVADFRWWIVNRGTTRLVVLADTTLPGLDWNATVLPSSFVLEPEQATELLFRVQSPQVLESTRAAASVALRAVEEGAVHAPVVLRVGLVVEGNPLVLGFFENPLPPPLDGSMGAFLLTFGFWVLFAAMTIAFQEPILKWFTRHASRRASLRIVQMLRVPVFVGVLFYGFRQSFETLPPVGYVGLAIRIVDAALILVWVYVIYKLFRAALAIALVFAKRTETTMDDIVLPILGKVGAVIIVLGGMLYFIGTLGIDLTVFVAGGVVVSMVLAFAAQDTLSNFFSGIFLLSDRPFVAGDDIRLATGEVCRVEEVGLRTTRLLSLGPHEIITVPNNQLAQSAVVNLGRPNPRYRMFLPFGVAYGSDIDKVKEIALRVANEHPGVCKEEGFGPFVQLKKFGDSSLDFLLGIFVYNYSERFGVDADVRERLYKTFEAEGIEIPFPQRVVHMRPSQKD